MTREMTQQDLADRIYVTRQTVIAIEGNKYSPSLEVAFRISNVFGLPLNEVFRYDASPAFKQSPTDEAAGSGSR